MRTLVAVLTLSVLLFGLDTRASGPPTAAKTPGLQVSSGRQPSSTEKHMLARLNQIRARGVSCPGSGPRPVVAALRFAAPQATSAFSQADYMAKSGEVSHTGPGGSTPRLRATGNGIQALSVAEIIYLGRLPDPERAVQWWLHSSVHCLIMTDPRYTTAGVSVVRGAQGTASVVVLTSSPK
jgi:uncharacterized protein YkwD